MSVQSLYYFFTGLWLVFHIAGFYGSDWLQTDLWLAPCFNTVKDLTFCKPFRP